MQVEVRGGGYCYESERSVKTESRRYLDPNPTTLCPAALCGKLQVPTFKAQQSQPRISNLDRTILRITQYPRTPLDKPTQTLLVRTPLLPRRSLRLRLNSLAPPSASSGCIAPTTPRPVLDRGWLRGGSGLWSSHRLCPALPDWAGRRWGRWGRGVGLGSHFDGRWWRGGSAEGLRRFCRGSMGSVSVLTAGGTAVGRELRWYLCLVVRGGIHGRRLLTRMATSTGCANVLLACVEYELRPRKMSASMHRGST